MILVLELSLEEEVLLAAASRLHGTDPATYAKQLPPGCSGVGRKHEVAFRHLPAAVQATRFPPRELQGSDHQDQNSDSDRNAATKIRTLHFEAR